MILNTVDVIAAKWLGWSIPGALDITEELMVFISILPIAYVAAERGHINITFVEERFSAKTRRNLLAMGYVIAILVISFVTWRVFTRFLTALQFGQLKKGIDLVIWPANLAVVLGFAFLAVIYILLLVKVLRSKPAEFTEIKP